MVWSLHGKGNWQEREHAVLASQDVVRSRRFAAILGMFVLYAKTRGMFDSTSDPTAWWIAIIAAALGTGGMVLAGHRRDLGRILNASVWIVMGMIVGSMLSPDYPPMLAIPGGVVGGIICVLVSWLDRPPAPPPK